MFFSMTYLTYDIENFWIFFFQEVHTILMTLFLSRESKKKYTTSSFTYPNFNAQKQ